MAPKLRSDKKRRRVRALAAPFVMTFGLAAGGCPGPADGPTETYNPPAPDRNGETMETDGTDEQKTPDTETPPETTETPPETTETPPETDGPNTHIVQRDDGTCWEHIEPDCPEPKDGVMVTCNPPPPREVPCPDDLDE